MSERTAREEFDRALGMARRCLAFWRRALLVFFVVGLVAVPFSLTRPRTYKSETVILYQENMASHLTGGEGGGGGEAARRLGARLREVLLSRASLEPIITEMHLFERLVDKRGMVDAVDEMRKQITFRAREGDTFEISYTGGNPDEVQEVTRRLGECIVREAASRRADQAKAVKAFVDAESDRNQIDLKAKEAALASFLAAHPEFARIAAAEAQGGAAATPGAPAPGAPAGAGGGADPQLAALEYRASRIQQQLAASPTAAAPPRPAPPPPQDSPELVAARRDLADKLARFTDKHPDVVAARARVKAAEAAQAAAQAAAQPKEEPPPPPVANEADREALKQQLANLQSQISARRAAVAANRPAPSSSAAAPSLPPIQEASVTLAVEYRRLQREVADARERQRQLDDKQFKASMTASSVTNDKNIQVSVLDPAYRPTHAISKPRSLLLGAALAICFVLALLTAIVSAWLDDRIHGRADLERLDILPVVGVIPRASTSIPPPEARSS